MMKYRGGGNYVVTITDAKKEDYVSYLETIQKNGFEVYADNGSGWGGTVSSTTLVKNRMILTIVYYAMTNQIKVSFYEGNVPKRLLYHDSYVEGNRADTKTSLHMLELWWFGNGFVIQLKNGHYIISDGGYRNDLAYLLDYLEEHAPEGEKPIVEAWIITHAHGDHSGALMTLVDTHPEWMERIIVEGVYASEPNDEVLKKCGGHTPHAVVKMAANWMHAEYIRPQTGQRYYFNDITMDILYSQEQIEEENYTNLNEASTVCLFTIEGQKCFLSGDIHEAGLEFLIANYPREFFELDFFTLNHHGFNTSQEFVDYATIQTTLITKPDLDFPVQRIRETINLMEKSKESLHWGDGTVIFEFPYALGQYKRLPNNEWKYDVGVEKPNAPSHKFSLWGNNYTGLIFDADAVLFDGNTLRPTVLEFLAFAKEKQLHMSVYSTKCDKDLQKRLKAVEIDAYFELVLEESHLDALAKSEEKFQTNHHKLVVLCKDIEAVKPITLSGVKTAVISYGEEVDESIFGVAWKVFADFHEFQEYLISRDVIYE